MEKLDRRQFLIGVGASGLGVAGAGLLAGCTGAEPQKEEGAQASESNSTTQTKAADNAGTAPIDPVEVPGGWDKEADIIIVGMSGGGLNAAVRARQLGLSVIVVDKLSLPGGNSRSATMFTIPGGTPQQNEAQAAIPSYPYEVDKWMEHIMTGMGKATNPEMLHLVGDNLPKCFNWMTENYGLDWTLGPDGTFLYVQPDGMSLIIDAAYELGQELGAEYLLKTEAQALVVDGERVVGVKVKSEDGGEQYLHGIKAVLLTGGGFAANKDLLSEYCPSAIERAAACYLSNSDSGECFRMGLGVGADVGNKNCITMFDGGMDWEKHGGGWCRYLFDGATQLVRQPWLSIRKDGSRVRYIDSAITGALTDQATVETAVPGNRTHVIFDANWDNYIKGMENYAQGFMQYECRMPVQDGMYKQECMPDYYKDYHAGVQDALDAGVICEAQTLEELAEMLELDPDVLIKSVEDWNATCARGTDDFVYPLKDEWLHPVSTPPYYGAKIGGFLFMTQTGLSVNTKLQVINEKGKVIPGLYAGWHTAAGPAAPDLMTSMSFDTGGVSKSYLGGYLAAAFISEEE